MFLNYTNNMAFGFIYFLTLAIINLIKKKQKTKQPRLRIINRYFVTLILKDIQLN